MSGPLFSLREAFFAAFGERPYLLPWPYTSGFLRTHKVYDLHGDWPIIPKAAGNACFYDLSDAFFIRAAQELIEYAKSEQAKVCDGQMATLVSQIVRREPVNAQVLNPIEKRLLRRCLDVFYDGGEDSIALISAQCLQDMRAQYAIAARERQVRQPLWTCAEFFWHLQAPKSMAVVDGLKL